MVGELNIFNSVQYLEPRCAHCGVKIDYGVNTEYDEKLKGHRCLKCGSVIE